MEIAFVLGLLVVAIILFASEKLSVDIVTFLILIALMASGILTPKEAFSGFSSDFIFILGSIFVISGAMQETGILDRAGANFVKYSGKSKHWPLFYIMAFPGAISAFMNNTTVTALFLNPTITVANKIGTSPSRLLMPLAFASILGGTCTVIGTSTNVAASGYISSIGMPPIGMFEMFPVGIAIFATGIIYMMLIGKRLLPGQNETDIQKEYALREYLTEILIMPDSKLIGQPVFASELTEMNFRIINMIRNHMHFYPSSTTHIEAGDILLVEGHIEMLMKVKETSGIEIRADILQKDIETKELRLAEILITPGSHLRRKTLEEAHFRNRYGLIVLAINRMGQTLREKLTNIFLKVGDVLLVQGSEDQFESIRKSQNFIVLDEFKPVLYKKRKGLLTLLVFAIAIIVSALGFLPLSVCFIAAAVVTVLLRAISVERAYEIIDWRLLVLIGGMSAFGPAMEKTGATEFLSHGILKLMEPLGITAILAGFIILTIILTQPLSNAAAALVVLPIAIKTAQLLHVNPRTFVISIMLAASISLIAPFEPSCIIVYAPGKYKFLDFVKVGTGMTMLFILIILFLVPLLWPW